MRISDWSSDVCSSDLPPDDTIAIRIGPCGETLLDAPAQPAMRLPGEVFQEQRVHRPLEPDVQLGDFAFGERDEWDARELEMLVEGGNVGLIARHAVERLRQHNKIGRAHV